MPNTPSAAPANTEAQELPSDLQHLIAAVESQPEQVRAELAPLLDRVTESTLRRRRILTLVQDALSQLRLDMKYLMFDLEATRRERDAYKSKLEEWED